MSYYTGMAYYPLYKPPQAVLYKQMEEPITSFGDLENILLFGDKNQRTKIRGSQDRARREKRQKPIKNKVPYKPKPSKPKPKPN